MTDEERNKLLVLINEYGELKQKAGESIPSDKYIEYTNESEGVFNKIVEIVDNIP